MYGRGVLGGVVGHSGAHSCKIDYASEVDVEMKKKTPVWLYHGQDDPMIPCELAARSYAIFDELNIARKFRTEDGLEHSLSMDSIKHLSAFFQANMP